MAKETLTVSNTALGGTAAVITDTSTANRKRNAESVLITVETDSIRYWMGATPTAAQGHLLVAGKSLVVDGYENIAALRMIRVTDDSTLQISSYRT